MTESTFTADILKYLREMGELAFKIADGFTTGIPDAAVIHPMGNDRVTTWFEMKLLKRDETFLERVKENKVQYTVMRALQPRSYYVIGSRGKIWIFKPEAFEEKNPQALIPEANKRDILDLVRLPWTA